MTKNVYEKDVIYFDVTDKDFFHLALKGAKRVFEGMEQDDIDIKHVKLNQTPVLYMSTVSSRKPSDNVLPRKEVNERGRRKFLIMDLDFDEGEEGKLTKALSSVDDFCSRHHTPVVIYPTASYPIKPRCRVVFFVKRVLTEATYHQAMTWLYEQLNIELTDKGDLNMKHNTNAPFFTNSEQLMMVKDTTQDELELLDNKLWKDMPKPNIKTKRSKRSQKSLHKELDEFDINEGLLREGTAQLLHFDNMKTYDGCWRFIYSLARANIVGQITDEMALNSLKMLAMLGKDKTERINWEVGNLNLYHQAKETLSRDDDVFNKTPPLLSMSVFKKIRLKQLEEILNESKS